MSKRKSGSTDFKWIFVVEMGRRRRRRRKREGKENRARSMECEKGEGFPLLYLINSHNFTRSLLHLLHLLQKVPKSRLCHHSIGSKEPHSKKFWNIVLFCWFFTSNYLIFVETLEKEEEHRRRTKRKKE